MATQQETRLRAAGVELRVLQRRGIENYFPRKVLESVLKRDLASYFPIPEDESVAARLGYSKSRNGEVVEHINLETDLSGTDLHAIIHEIAAMARDTVRE